VLKLAARLKVGVWLTMFHDALTRRIAKLWQMGSPALASRASTTSTKREGHFVNFCPDWLAPNIPGRI
jgi:hypothetical protein